MLQAREASTNPVTCVCMEVTSGQSLRTLGTFQTKVPLKRKVVGAAKTENVGFTVTTEVPRLNLLGQDAIIRLGVNIPALLGVSTVKEVDGNKWYNQSLLSRISHQPLRFSSEAYKGLCQEFPDLFKHELECLKVRLRHASQEDAETRGAPVFSSATSELDRAGGTSEPFPEANHTKTTLPMATNWELVWPK